MAKTEKSPLFFPSSFFLSRTPLFPIDNFFSLSKKKDVKHFLLSFYENTPEFRQAIAIASPSLHRALKNNKVDKQVLSSLLKYFSRMTSRSTPFGLFSFVSLGSIKEAVFAKIELSNVEKKVRPDMEWLISLIDSICENSAILPYLTLRKNCLIYEKGGRFYLNYFRKKKEDKREKISVSSTFLIQAILGLAEKPIRIDKLIEEILKKHSNLEKDKLFQVIKHLLELQFLNFTLIPSLFTDSPFEDLLKKLSLIDYPFPNLERIKELIEVCNGLKWEEENLESIQKEMESTASVENYVQVDAIYKGEEIAISKEIANQFAEASELCWRLSHADSYPQPLDAYRRKFIEKYGLDRLVPLFEVLNENEGLGIPEHYLGTRTIEKQIKQESRWKKWLKMKWIECLRKKADEIELDEKLGDELIEKEDLTMALSSFDLHCEIIADSSSNIEAGEYLLSILAYSLQGGASFGRFLYLFDSEQKEKLKSFFLSEEQLEKDTLFVESSYLSHTDRVANVSIHPKMRCHGMNLVEPAEVSLNEIYVGATMERLYLTKESSNKEVVVTAGNVVKEDLAPFPLRFVREVSIARSKVIYSFPWDDLHDSPYLPRVRYKKVILSPAQWQVDLFQLGITKKEDLETIGKYFSQWALQWKLPRYFFLFDFINSDQRILIDRDYPPLMNEVLLRLKKGQRIKLTEKIGQKRGQWVESQKGTHLSEFVIPFIKNPKYSSQKSLHFPKISTPKNRWKLPGSEWLYVKFYLDTEQENRFLLLCKQFLEPFVQKQIIDEWFFVRYSDPKSHLRLRFLGDRDKILSLFLPALHDLASTLLQKKYFQEMSIASYEREIERYGGEELMQLAESLFYGDSLTSITLTQCLVEKKISLPEEVICALSFINLLKQLGFDFSDQLDFHSLFEMDKKELAGFREWRRTLESLGLEILDDPSRLQTSDAFLLNDAFEKRKAAANAYEKEINKSRKLTTTKLAICDSILHLHTNRFLGKEKSKEIKARLYAYQTLQTIKRRNYELSVHLT